MRNLLFAKDWKLGHYFGGVFELYREFFDSSYKSIEYSIGMSSIIDD